METGGIGEKKITRRQTYDAPFRTVFRGRGTYMMDTPGSVLSISDLEPGGAQDFSRNLRHMRMNAVS